MPAVSASPLARTIFSETDGLVGAQSFGPSSIHTACGVWVVRLWNCSADSRPMTPFWLYTCGFSQAGGTGDLSVRQFVEATTDLLENSLVAQPLQVDARHAGGIEIATPRDSLSTCNLQGAISVGLDSHSACYKP
jgi:hypothetical protein